MAPRTTQRMQQTPTDTRPGWLEYFVGTAYLNRATDFDGKTARKTFWGNWAWMFLFGLTAIAISVLLSRNCCYAGFEWTDLLWPFFLLITIVPTLAIGARRLNDAGWSPLLVGFYAVPLLALAVWWMWPGGMWRFWLLFLVVLVFCVVFAILHGLPGGTACPPTRCKPVDIIVLVLCLLLILAALFKCWRDCHHPLRGEHAWWEWIDEHPAQLFDWHSVDYLDGRTVEYRGGRPVDVHRVVDHVIVTDTVVVIDTVAVEESNDLVDQANDVGGSGDLKVTLLWNFYSDIDLHVKQPNGREIYYSQPHDNNTGGYLDVDNTRGGQGSAENMFWDTPPSGRYEISLVYFSAPSGSRGGNCTVVIQQKGRAPQTYNVVMDRVNMRKPIATITVP